MAIAGRPLIRVQTGRVVGIIDGRGRTKGRERQRRPSAGKWGGRTDGDRYSHFCVMIIVIAGLLTNTLTYAFAAPFGRKVRQNHPFGDFFPEMPQKCFAFLCYWHFRRNDIGNFYDREISYRFAHRRTAEMTRICQDIRRDDAVSFAGALFGRNDIGNF